VRHWKSAEDQAKGEEVRPLPGDDAVHVQG